MSNPANLMRAPDARQYRASGAGAPQNIQAAVRQASDRTGVDFSYLMAKAAQESSFDPEAKAASSSATGLYQFIESTWLNMVDQHGGKYGLEREAAQVQRRSDGTPYVADPQARRDILEMRKDPKISSYMAAEFARDNQSSLQQSVGGEIGSTELYMAHFLGAGGAAKFLNGMKQNPGQNAAALLPEAAAANRGVFYDKAGQALSVGQIYDRFAAKFEGMGRAGGSVMTAQAGAIGMPGGRGAWASEAGLRSPFTRSAGAATGVQSGEPTSLFTVMVLSQLGTPKDEGARDAENGGNGQKGRNGSSKAMRTPMPSALKAV